MSPVRSEFLAYDAYPAWKRRVRAAEHSVRIYSPYLDRMAVSLVGNSSLPVECISVVTDLSPASSALDYRGQLLALKRLLIDGVEVRSLARLHAKVLLIDGATATIGSQNFTSYGRGSHETTAAPNAVLGRSQFVETLEQWYREAESVDLEFIELLLDQLGEPIATARNAINALITSYEEAEQGYREQQKTVRTRFKQDLAKARMTSTAAGIQQAATTSRYSTGQTVAYARLDWVDAEYRSLLRSSNDVDLTQWRIATSGLSVGTVRLARLAFYPVLLGPGGQMAFARVASSRITFVWRGVRWGAPLTIGGHRLYVQASFPDQQEDGSNLAITFGWSDGASKGYQMRLQFDGASVLPVANGRLVGEPEGGETLTQIIEDAYENEGAWSDVLREVFAPAYNPSGFLREKNAATFFPAGWLRIDHTKFIGESVLLIQPLT